MTTRRIKSHYPSALIIALGLLLAGRTLAQTYTNVLVFTGPPAEGSLPQSTLVQSGNTVYATTTIGGTNGSGTVFKVNLDGTGYSNLYSFSVLSFPFAPHTNSDGAQPSAGLALSGNTLYGTAYEGGAKASGTIFKLNTDGSGFTNLYTFTNGNDGSSPAGVLVVSGNILYGTATSGGTNGDGSVFAIHTDGSHFTNLYSFTAGSDGGIPQAGLILSNGVLYGTTTSGGNNGSGVVFSIQTNGQNFTNIYDFTPTDPDTGTNEDGAFCQAPLILSGSTLYGTTTGGGTNADGVVFRVDTNGLNFTNLYTFSATVVGVGGGPYGSNIDGDMPQAGLVLVGKTLYGTTPYGGASGNGTVFSIATDGTNFVNLHSFANSPTEGAEPLAGLILSGTTFYGTEYSDDNSEGAVFGLSGVPLSIPAQLTITQFGTNVVLTWPTFETNYTLQANTNLNSPGTWTNLSGQFTVTNPITGKQKFYRLFQ